MINLHNTDYFEIISPKQCYLVIEIVECYGRIKAYMDTNINNLRQGIYETQIMQQPGYSYYYAYQKVQPGKIFVSVKAIYGSTFNLVRHHNPPNHQQAHYQIRAQFVDTKQNVEQNRFAMGANGFINWSVNK